MSDHREKKPNPYESPSAETTPAEVSSDPSLAFEPHLQHSSFDSDARTEQIAEGNILASPSSPTDPIDHSVFDEPGLSTPLVGTLPPDALTYARWIEERIQQTTTLETWCLSLGISLVSGAMALLGTMFLGSPSASGSLLVGLFGPLIEEVMKISLIIWVVEKRPYLFKSPIQIAICAAASGLVFGFVENVLYLGVYIDNPDATLILWRWIVCTLLHVTCTSIAAIGIIRVWQDVMQHRHRPRLTLGSRWIIAAIVLHAVYNIGVMIVTAGVHAFA